MMANTKIELLLIYINPSKIHVVEYYDDSNKIENKALLSHPGLVDIVESHKERSDLLFTAYTECKTLTQT